MTDATTVDPDFLAAREEHIAAAKSPSLRRGYEDGNGAACSALDYLRLKLGIDVTGATQYGTDVDAEFDLILEGDERIRLGTAEALLKQDKPLAAIAVRTHVALHRFKSDEWVSVVQGVLDIAEVVDTGDTQDAETRAWLVAFFASSGQRVDENDRDAFAAALKPGGYNVGGAAIIGTERLYLHLPSFITHISTRYRLRLTRAQISARLARLGFEQRRETVRPSVGPQVRRNLWASPDGFHLDHEGQR